MTKSSVSQRIRAPANDLQQIIGVVDIDEDQSPTAALIGLYGGASLEALGHFVPDAAPALRAADRPTFDNLDLYVTKIAQHTR